ncbi:MAG: hypothetical protein WCA07_12865 [Gloeobacterales cyanobacterium]
MSQKTTTALCIIDVGIILNKRDMVRLLEDLSRVRYQELCGGNLRKKGDGYIMEVYDDPSCSTLVANQTLYLNVSSFEYLELGQCSSSEEPGLERPCFDLVQGDRVLRLIPLTNPLEEQERSRKNSHLDSAIEDVLLDVALPDWDDEDDLDL